MMSDMKDPSVQFSNMAYSSNYLPRIDAEKGFNLHEAVLKANARTKKWIAYSVVVGSIAVLTLAGIMVGLYLSGSLKKEPELAVVSEHASAGRGDALTAGSMTGGAGKKSLDGTINSLGGSVPTTPKPTPSAPAMDAALVIAVGGTDVDNDNDAVGGVAEGIQEAAESIADAVSEVVDSASDVIDNQADAASDVLSDNPVVEPVKEMSENVEEALKNTAENTESLNEAAQVTVEDLLGNIHDQFDDVAELLENPSEAVEIPMVNLDNDYGDFFDDGYDFDDPFDFPDFNGITDKDDSDEEGDENETTDVNEYHINENNIAAANAEAHDDEHGDDNEEHDDIFDDSDDDDDNGNDDEEDDDDDDDDSVGADNDDEFSDNVDTDGDDFNDNDAFGDIFEEFDDLFDDLIDEQSDNRDNDSPDTERDFREMPHTDSISVFSSFDSSEDRDSDSLPAVELTAPGAIKSLTAGVFSENDSESKLPQPKFSTDVKLPDFELQKTLSQGVDILGDSNMREHNFNFNVHKPVEGSDDLPSSNIDLPAFSLNFNNPIGNFVADFSSPFETRPFPELPIPNYTMGTSLLFENSNNKDSETSLQGSPRNSGRSSLQEESFESDDK